MFSTCIYSLVEFGSRIECPAYNIADRTIVGSGQLFLRVLNQTVVAFVTDVELRENFYCQQLQRLLSCVLWSLSLLHDLSGRYRHSRRVLTVDFVHGGSGGSMSYSYFYHSNLSNLFPHFIDYLTFFVLCGRCLFYFVNFFSLL